MDSPATYPRLNIYLNDTELRTQVKIVAARRGVSVSEYCVEAIRRRLAEDESQATWSTESPQIAAEALDRLRLKIGPIGVPVRELIAEGRRR